MAPMETTHAAGHRRYDDSPMDLGPRRDEIAAYDTDIARDIDRARTVADALVPWWTTEIDPDGTGYGDPAPTGDHLARCDIARTLRGYADIVDAALAHYRDPDATWHGGEYLHITTTWAAMNGAARIAEKVVAASPVEPGPDDRAWCVQVNDGTSTCVVMTGLTLNRADAEAADLQSTFPDWVDVTVGITPPDYRAIR